MFHNERRTQVAEMLGMFGVALFFAGLLIEYHYGLFPPGSGTLYVINQLVFLLGLALFQSAHKGKIADAQARTVV